MSKQFNSCFRKNHYITPAKKVETLILLKLIFFETIINKKE